MSLTTIYIDCPHCSNRFRTHSGGDVTYCPRCSSRLDKHENRIPDPRWVFPAA